MKKLSTYVLAFFLALILAGSLCPNHAGADERYEKWRSWYEFNMKYLYELEDLYRARGLDDSGIQEAKKLIYATYIKESAEARPKVTDFTTGAMTQHQLSNNESFKGPIININKIGENKWKAKWANGEKNAPWKITISLFGDEIRIDEHHSNQEWIGKFHYSASGLIGEGKERGGKYTFSIQLR